MGLLAICAAPVVIPLAVAVATWHYYLKAGTWVRWYIRHCRHEWWWLKKWFEWVLLDSLGISVPETEMGELRCARCSYRWDLPKNSGLAFDDIQACVQQRCPFAGHDVSYLLDGKKKPAIIAAIEENKTNVAVKSIKDFRTGMQPKGKHAVPADDDEDVLPPVIRVRKKFRR